MICKCKREQVVRRGVGTNAGRRQAAGGRAGNSSPCFWGPTFPCSLAHWDHEQRSYQTAGDNLELATCAIAVMCVHVGANCKHTCVCASVLALCKTGWLLVARRSEETLMTFLLFQNIFLSTPSRM